MGAHGRGPDPRRDRRARRPTTPTPRSQVIIDDRQINEVQRKATAMIAATIATQQPGRARPALPAHARPRDLRARAHGRPRVRRSPSRRASSRRTPPLRRLRRPAAARASWSPSRCAGSSARWSTSTRSRRARSRPLDDEVDDLYHAIFDEVLELMREDPAQRRARDADPVRRALPRADRRPGDEHRRGHRVPRLGRGRGPEPVTEPTHARRPPRPRRVHGERHRRRPGPDPRRVLGQQRAVDPRRGAAPAPRRRPGRRVLGRHRARRASTR